MTRADLLVGPQTDTSKRMSFKEKKKKIRPDGMMKGMISQLAWQRQDHHNLPTRWSESQGEAELHCSPHFGTGRSGMGWRRGCLLNGHSRSGAQTLSPHLLPCLDNLPGGGDCLLQAFEFCPSTVQYGTGRVAREMRQSRRAEDTSLESGVETGPFYGILQESPSCVLAPSSQELQPLLINVPLASWSSATGGVELGPNHVSCTNFKVTCFPSQGRQRFNGLLSHEDAVMNAATGRGFSGTGQGFRG